MAALKLPEWQRRAACRGLDPDLFFPDRGKPATYAKRVCADCPVRTECLAYGFKEEHGVWGGTTREDRKKMRRTLKCQAA